jgi:tetratricopeptide (TPR) repeat protein
MGRYLHDLLPPMQILVVVLALLAAALLMRNRWRDLIAPAVFLLGGILALLPNSLLPGHYESQYAWNGAPLVFAVVLFVPAARRSGILTQLLLAATALYSVHANARIYSSAPQQWLLNEEHANARIAQALPVIRGAAGGANRLLVTGLTASFHPWEYPEFIREYFGPGRQWTLVVSRTAPESKEPNVAMVRARGVRLEDYDGAVRFREDSGLQDVLVGAAYNDAVAHNPEAVLLPALSKQAQELAAKPGDFMTLLKMGTLALSSGLPERALPYLRRAAEAGPTNPYPWFFMGQALRDANDPGAARRAFEKAIALDGPNPNPAFRQSLSDLPPK